MCVAKRCECSHCLSQLARSPCPQPQKRLQMASAVGTAQVYLTPASFDFETLFETASLRFEGFSENAGGNKYEPEPNDQCDEEQDECSDWADQGGESEQGGVPVGIKRPRSPDSQSEPEELPGPMRAEGSTSRVRFPVARASNER